MKNVLFSYFFAPRYMGTRVHVPSFTTSSQVFLWGHKSFLQLSASQKRKTCFCVAQIWIDETFLPQAKDEMTDHSESELLLLLIVIGSRLLLINSYDVWQLLVIKGTSLIHPSKGSDTVPAFSKCQLYPFLKPLLFKFIPSPQTNMRWGSIMPC